MLPVRVACDGVILRSFALPDAPRVAELCGEHAVAAMTARIPHPYTTAMALAWIEGLSGADDPAREFVYAVLRRDDALLVGAVGLRSDPGAADTIGYWIGQPFWGRGYATAAASAAIALGFTALELSEVEATHLARNPASGRVMAKCGMREVRREQKSHRGGAPERFLVWSIDSDAWRSWIDRPPASGSGEVGQQRQSRLLGHGGNLRAIVRMIDADAETPAVFERAYHLGRELKAQKVHRRGLFLVLSL